MADESASTEVPESESESFAEEITTDSDERYPQIEGLSDNVTLSYTQIGSDDPIIGLVIADILPDIHAKDLNITNVQAYRMRTLVKMIPAGKNTPKHSQMVLILSDTTIWKINIHWIMRCSLSVSSLDLKIIQKKLAFTGQW